MNRKRMYSLRPAVILSTVVVFIIYIFVFTMAYNKLVSTILLKEEEETVLKYSTVIQNSITVEKNHIKSLAVFLSQWEDINRLASGKPISGGFILLDYFDADLLAVTNVDGDIMHLETWDHYSRTYMEPDDDFIEAISGLAVEYNQGLREQINRHGILSLKDRTVYLYMIPIIKGGEYKGSIILGNNYTEKRISMLTGHSDISLYVTYDETYLSKGNTPIISTDRVEMVMPAMDVYGEDVGIVMYLDRDSYYENRNMLSMVPVILSVCTFLLLVVLYFIYIRLTVVPVEKFSRKVEESDSSDNIKDAFAYSGAKEFHSLCTSICELMDRLNESKISYDILEHVLNGVDGTLYTTDMETDEILFFNDNLKKDFQNDQIFRGTKCYDFMGEKAGKRCTYCPKDQLIAAPDDIIVWDKEEADGRTFHKVDCLIEWKGKKKVHLQHSVDITKMKETEKKLSYKLQQQNLINDLLRNFLVLDDITSQVYQLLKSVGEFMQVSRVVLLHMTSEDEELVLENIWYKERTYAKEIGMVSDHCPIVKKLAYNSEKALDASDEDHAICYNSSESDKYAMAVECGVYSQIASHIYFDGKAWGVICFEQCDRVRNWTDDELTFVKIVAKLLSNFYDYRMISRELMESKENAERSSHAKTNFLSRMSHEMRTPMNAIIGMTAIGQQSDDIEKVKKCLGKIEDASNHLLGVINDILDISKIEAGKLDLYNNDFTIRELIRVLTNVVNFRIAEKGQNFEITIEPDIPQSIISDQQHLSQVLTNIVSNAVKFTPEKGDISLHVECMEKEEEATLKFSVTDSGIGISEEQIPRLFQAFEQADGGISRKFGGTGLGLAISKNIVELMGGTIWVESEIGKGSKFIFTIKTAAGRAHLQAAHEKNNLSDRHDHMKNRFVGHHILIAEDIEINFEIILQLLEPTGLLIDWASDGREAIESFTNNQELYELILMDIHMPEVDGYEAARQIRAISGDIPIIAMTANVFREDVERCLNVGMNGHIGKPIELQALFDVLEKYLLSTQ